MAKYQSFTFKGLALILYICGFYLIAKYSHLYVAGGVYIILFANRLEA